MKTKPSSEAPGRPRLTPLSPAGPREAAKRPDEPTPEPAPDLAPVVGANLRRMRVKRGLSLERLARASGVSRAMLGQIELGQSAPTINVLWKIASALKQMGNRVEALDALRLGHAIMIRLTALSPDNAGWKRDLDRFAARIAELSR